MARVVNGAMVWSDVKPWEKEGPKVRAPREVDRALSFWHTAKRRPPTEADAPPVSVLPMTRAARTAIRLYREGWAA